MQTPRARDPQSSQDKPLTAPAGNSSDARDADLHAARLAGVAEAAAGMAHEIRNLLQHLEMAFDLFSEQPLSESPEAASQRTVIEREFRQLLEFADHLSELARPLQLKLESCRLGEVWNETAREMAPRAAQRGITIPEWPGDIDDRCTLDRDAVRQLFDTILGYVVTSRSEASRIELVCHGLNEAGGPQIELLVRDDGPALSQMQRKALFDLFTPAQGGRRGLQMARCRRIVEAHGGAMEVASETRGFEFVIRLPRHPS